MALKQPRGPIVAFWIMLALVLGGMAAVLLREPAGRPGEPAQPSAPAQVAQQTAVCGFDPMAPEGASGDGQLRLRTDVEGKTAADAAGLLWLGQEAAGQRRSRDAEVAFIMACRVGAHAQGPESEAVAEAKLQLGRHYLALTTPDREGAPGAGTRMDMLRRAQAVLYESRLSFVGRHGPEHEKTRLSTQSMVAARDGLAAGAVAQAPPPSSKPAPPPRAPEPAQAAVAPPAAPAQPVQPTPLAQPVSPSAAPPPQVAVAPRPVPEVVERPRAPPARPEAPPAQRAAAPPAARADEFAGSVARPSFDCAKARSAPEKMICADPELARLDRELGGLHARAKRAAPDRTAFNRRNEQEWKRREANCRDRMCLFAWYAERRQQLENELQQPQAGNPASRDLRPS